MEVRIAKNRGRLANPVCFWIIPLTVIEAESMGIVSFTRPANDAVSPSIAGRASLLRGTAKPNLCRVVGPPWRFPFSLVFCYRVLQLLEVLLYAVLYIDGTFSSADKNDFNASAITLLYPADEISNVNDIPVFIPIVDDETNEALRQYFIILLEVKQAVNLDLITIARNSSIGIIIDNDGELILYSGIGR